MKILLHPTHRKFVKLLREKINSGQPIIITQADLDEFERLMKRSKKALVRHKGIYKIFLRAINRSSIDCQDVYVNQELIDYIESVLCKVEWYNPLITIRNIVLVPILRKIIRFIS